MNKPKLITTAVITLAFALMARGAFAGEAKEAKDVIAPPPPVSPINLLINVEFANEYTTPRGMIVRDDGVTIQPLLLAFINVYKGDSFINFAKLVGGVWNDTGTSSVSEHAPYGSDPKTNWTEIDPIAGVSIGFAKYFTLDVTYTAFVEQILDIGTSNHLETKIAFHDSEFLKCFALHPYVSYWLELDGKATAAKVPQAVFGPSPKSGDHPDPNSSWYFDIGIAPSYTFKDWGLTVEAPCRVLLPNERFYGEYYDEASVIGLFELGVKATQNLTFMPKGYGNWSIHAGVKYMNFVDDNLYHLNTFNAPGEPTRTTWVFYSGISVFF